MSQPNKKRAIISHFSRTATAESYFAGGRIAIKAKNAEHRLVSELLASENPRDKKALDIGCGVGGYFDILLEKGFHIVGLDIAEGMVTVCHSKYADSDSVELARADLENLPLRPDCFDLILCIDTLQYVNNESRRLALQEMVKLVKQGGLIIVEVKNKACPAFWLSRWRGDLAQLYSIASVTSVLKRSGAKILAVRGVFKPTFLSPIVVVKARKTAEE